MASSIGAKTIESLKAAGFNRRGESPILKTVSYTLALTDNYGLSKCLSSAGIIITIPLNSSVAFPVDSEITIVRYGTGAVSFALTPGVTLNSSGSKRFISNQYEIATLKKMATDEWLLIGSLST